MYKDATVKRNLEVKFFNNNQDETIDYCKEDEMNINKYLKE